MNNCITSKQCLIEADASRCPQVVKNEDDITVKMEQDLEHQEQVNSCDAGKEVR